jgi:UDP-glucose 4-epimerase
MQNKDLQVRTLFERMLAKTDQYSKTYEHYTKDMKNYRATVQWNLGPTSGYQVFNGSEYSHEIDAEIESPDILIECDDPIIARKFFRNEFEDMRDLAMVDFEISSGKFPRKPGTGNSWRIAQVMVAKLPPFRSILERTHGTDHSTSVAIPINENLGKFNNEIMPYAVVEHFVKKASHVFIYDICPCRVAQDCKDFSKTDFGCMVLGRGVLRMKPNDGFHIQGHLGTKEEALDRTRKAVDAGLIPGFGRLRGDAINRIGGPIPDTGDLFNMCFCCPCCCVVGGVKHAPSYLRSIFQKFEGLNVTVDDDACTDCGECAEACIFGALEMVDDKVERDWEKCFGCGRCVTACPTEALGIELEEDSVEKMIARIEAHVDVT